MTKSLKFFGLLLIVGLLFTALPTGQARAADINVACLGTDDTALLQGAINGASDGDVLLVSGTCVLSANINVNKDVTIDGGETAKIQVSGTGYRISMIYAGATVQNFDIEKTDKTGVQDIFWVQANDVTIANNKIHGQFVIGDNDVSRAMVVSGGYTNLLITGNEFYSLRQPAYITGVVTGTISNNYTHGTKGWVIEGGEPTFTGNTWGSGANANVYDIAILSLVNTSHYTNVPAMSAANNNAFIEDQRTSPARLTPVYVDASAPACTDCGTARMPYKTIQEGIDRVIPGGTVNVLPGIYSETAANRTISTLGGTYQFGLFFPVDKPGITLQGVKADGSVITNAADVAAHIITNSTSNFGPSGVFVDAENITITGLDFGDNYNGAAVSNNKTVEVIGDNFTFKYNWITTTGGGSLYISDFSMPADNRLKTYTVEGNRFKFGASLDISSGAGIEGLAADRKILNNTFSADGATATRASISFNGTVPSVGWFLYQVGGATITGNTFTDVPMPIRSRGLVEDDFDWMTYYNSNNFQRKVLILDPAGNPRGYDYTSGSYTLNNTILIGSSIQNAINNATAGDTILVGPGTYNENIVIPKALTLTGAGRDLVTIQGSNTADNGVFEIKADGITVEGFTIIGAGNKTVRVTTATSDLVFKNNRVITATNPSNSNHGWTAFETNYNQTSTNHQILGNVFVGNNSSQLVYYNPGIVGLTFTGNTFEGTMVNNMNMGPVLGFDGLDGMQTVTGNTFNVQRSGGDKRYSVYALVEAFGTYDLNTIVAANTFQFNGAAHPAVVFKNKIRPAYIYNSTNELNKTKQTPGHIGQNAPFVQLVSLDALTNKITVNFKNPTTYNVGYEVRLDGEASLTPNTPHYNPWLPDYLYRVVYPGSGTHDTNRSYTVSHYLEVRSTFGSERDFDFDWVRYEIIPNTYADDSWVGLADGTSVTPAFPVGSVAHTIGYDAFATIQEAIDAVASNGHVYVQAGMYNETLSIYKALTLQGEVGGGGTRLAKIVSAGVTQITASHVTFDSFDYSAPDANGINISNDSPAAGQAYTDVTISNNYFHNVGGFYGGGTKAIKSAWGVDNLHIINNIFDGITNTVGTGTGNRSSNAITIGDSATTDKAEGLLISGNTFANISAAKNGAVAININNKAGAVGTISDNTFAMDTIACSSAGASAIAIDGMGMDLDLTGNTFTAAGAVPTNTIGVAVSSQTGPSLVNVHFEDNHLAAGSYVKVANAASQTMDATPNYWGSACGPLTPWVVGPVDYDPWYTDEAMTLLSSVAGVYNFTPSTGTEAINQALACAAPGSTFNFAAGDYSAGFVVPAGRDGHRLVLADGVKITATSPCFDVQASYTIIEAANIGMASCVTAAGSNGIDVGAGLVNIVVDGLEIYGPGNDGIHFAGAVTDVVLVDNYIHDLAGNGLYFGGQPAQLTPGGIDIHGNLFQNNVGNGIEAGSFTVPAEYNSWGVTGGPSAGDGISNGVDADPWTHVDVYMVADGTPWTPALNQVVVGQQITFTVKAHVVNALGVQVNLHFPTNLTLASTDITTSAFSALAGIVTTPTGTISFYGLTTSMLPVTGDVELFKATFTGTTAGLALPMNLDETNDVFSMAGVGSSTNIYAVALTDSTVNVVVLPVIDIVPVVAQPGPYTAGLPIEFNVTVTNSDGGNFADLHLDWTLPTGAVLQYWDGDSWETVTDPTDIGTLATGGTAFDPVLPLFRVTFATPPSGVISVGLWDLAPTTDYELATTSETFVLLGNFTVTGSFSMQGRQTRAGLPVTLTYQPGLMAYGPVSGSTVNTVSNNLTLTPVNGGSWLLTTNQPRYLNVLAANNKLVTVDGNETLVGLQLKGGNADSNYIVNVVDAGAVGTAFGTGTIADDGDCNFDNQVNVQDLALVGGNYGLTNLTAYGDGNANIWTVQ